MSRKTVTDTNEFTTRVKILFAAKQEFFEKGFAAASVRTIAEKAGLTTGALYNLFKNKDNIFDALVGTVFDEFIQLLKQDNSPQDSEYNMKTTDLSTIMEISRERFLMMVDFFYANWDILKLIICCSKGSSYEHIFDKVITLIENETIRWLQYDGITISPRMRFFIHVMVSSQFENLSEIFYHNLTKQEAIEYLLDFNIYHCAGWKQYWLEHLNKNSIANEQDR